MRLIQEMLGDVQRFNEEVVGLPVPEEPRLLSADAFSRRTAHMKEEFEELRNAQDWSEQADALTDLIYVALGALVEMGIVPGSVFNEVHEANMKKERGTKPERPDSGGNDAIKPEGWAPPDVETAALPLSALKGLSPVLVEVTRLRALRSRTYNVGSVQLEDYFPHGDMSYHQMCHVKLLRAKSIIEGGRGELTDSLFDLINYATFWLEWTIEEDEQ